MYDPCKEPGLVWTVNRRGLIWHIVGPNGVSVCQTGTDYATAAACCALLNCGLSMQAMSDLICGEVPLERPCG